MSEFTVPTPLTRLCQISREACSILSDFVVPCYETMNSETSKLKADKSVFTIADGIVQHLLIEHLYVKKFANIVGEEDGSAINITTKPYTVDELVVPDIFFDIIDSTRAKIEALASNIDSDAYQALTVFIDPIDGTREFATGKGEQCSICIGFSDQSGHPVAGIVYRPITTPHTYAAGAKSEGYFDCVLDECGEKNPKGLLTSNGNISPFIGHLIDELGYTRVPSGGAGNKMLMLLEGKGGCYIQDRGVSRWDTCAAQAAISAAGGILSKLSPFVENKSLESYNYLKSDVNLDFVPGLSFLTPYNADIDKDTKDRIKAGEKIRFTEPSQAKVYSNLCGLFALAKGNLEAEGSLENFHNAILRAQEKSPPAFD